MAPVLSALWGPEGAGSGVARETSLGNEQLVLVGALMVISAIVLLSVLLMLCAGCQGQKKAAPHQVNGDHETLMNGVSEKETVSQSVDSPGTDLAVSSSHNGPLTCATVLTDTQDTSPHPSEEMLSSQSELRSSKCPQDRELPSIPPNSALEGMIGGSADEPPATGDGTYEVVKEVVSASRDVSVEDSLYETVKELKAPPPSAFLNGTPPHHLPPSALPNGLSPGTPERGPLCAGVEYASVDLNKKSRYSADLEARRSASLASSVARGASSPGEEPEEEEERPPPVPDKVLDENENQTGALAPREGLPLPNGEVHSPVSPSLDLDRVSMENELYSSVDKQCGGEEPENDYSSIGELKDTIPASSSNHLYATVRDLYPQDEDQALGGAPAPDSSDPGYETIRIPKTGDDGEECSGGATLDQTPVEHDYENVAEMGLNRETSRL